MSGSSRHTASSATVISLLRHGEVLGGNRFRGHTDDQLTSMGWQQMRTAVKTGGWERLITSPLIRCAAFAEEYAQRFAIPYSCDTRLMEINFGTWEGRTAAELIQSDSEALTRLWEDPLHNTPPGGEPLLQFQARVLAAWDDIVTQNNERQTLIVTHGGVIRVLLCHLLKQPLTQLQSFDVGHGSIRHVQIDHLGNASVCDED